LPAPQKNPPGIMAAVELPELRHAEPRLLESGAYPAPIGNSATTARPSSLSS
jgi:hypothetical protein